VAFPSNVEVDDITGEVTKELDDVDLLQNRPPFQRALVISGEDVITLFIFAMHLLYYFISLYVLVLCDLFFYLHDFLVLIFFCCFHRIKLSRRRSISEFSFNFSTR
jgi:hypothetical protein